MHVSVLEYLSEGHGKHNKQSNTSLTIKITNITNQATALMIDRSKLKTKMKINRCIIEIKNL